MRGLNKVILIGNLGKDPEVRSFDTGRSKASFSLATSESYKNKSGERVTQTEWHNIVLWSPLAEIASQYLKKGSSVYIEGKITNRSYDDKDGNKKFVTEIIGDSLLLLDRREGGDGGGDGPSYNQERQYQQPQQAQRAQAPKANEGDYEDDLPF